jgi:hypothetical protein
VHTCCGCWGRRTVWKGWAQCRNFLTKRIGIVNNSFTVAGNHIAQSEITHEANTSVTKVLTKALFKTETKSLVGLHLDALATTQMDFKDMLLVGGLRAKRESRNSAGRAALNTRSGSRL